MDIEVFKACLWALIVYNIIVGVVQGTIVLIGRIYND